MEENNELVIEMQSRPLPEDARSVPMGYNGSGFWSYDGKKYIWIDSE